MPQNFPLNYEDMLENELHRALSQLEYWTHYGDWLDSEDSKDFYDGEDWRRFRNLFLEYKGYQCERCGKCDGNLDVHHRYGLFDIGSLDCFEALCRNCHEEEHGRKFDE